MNDSVAHGKRLRKAPHVIITPYSLIHQMIQKTTQGNLSSGHLLIWLHNPTSQRLHERYLLDQHRRFEMSSTSIVLCLAPLPRGE